MYTLLLRYKKPTNNVSTIPKYDDLKYCAEILKKGIDVIKHNYSNLESKKVSLWLSKNEKTLYYKPLETQNKLFAYFRGARTINLSNIRGFIYGPFSSTFQARKP